MIIVKDKVYNMLWRLFCAIWFIVASALFAICTYIKKTYGVSLEEIINTLLLPTEGTNITVLLDAIKFCIPIIFCIGIITSTVVCIIDMQEER